MITLVKKTLPGCCPQWFVSVVNQCEDLKKKVIKIVLYFLFESFWLQFPAISLCHAVSTKFKSLLVPDIFPLWKWPRNWVIATSFFFFLKNGTDRIPLVSPMAFLHPLNYFHYGFFFHTTSLLPNSFQKGEPQHRTQHLVGNKFLHGGKTTISIPTHYLDLHLWGLHLSGFFATWCRTL